MKKIFKFKKGDIHDITDEECIMEFILFKITKEIDNNTELIYKNDYEVIIEIKKIEKPKLRLIRIR